MKSHQVRQAITNLIVMQEQIKTGCCGDDISSFLMIGIWSLRELLSSVEVPMHGRERSMGSDEEGQQQLSR